MRTLAKAVGNTFMGAHNVGGVTPLLAEFRFLGSDVGKTATLLLYSADGLVIDERVITVGTSVLAATDNSLWAGDWSEEFVGAKVLACDATIYAMAPVMASGTPALEVTAGRGTPLEVGMCIGIVPMIEREKFVANSLQIDNVNITGSGIATSAKQDTLAALVATAAAQATQQTALDAINNKTPDGWIRVEVAVAMPDSNAIAAGDLIFEAAAIADAVRAIDKHSELGTMEIVDEQLVINGGTGKAFTIWFEKNNNDWGTVDAAVALSITNARHMLGNVPVLASKYKVLRTGAGTGGHARMFFNRSEIGGIAMIPKSGTRIVYFACVADEAIDTSASTSPFFYFIFHLIPLN